MDAQAALNQLLGSLVKSMQESAQERKTAGDAYYAELTGRIELMRTVIAFIQQSLQPDIPEEKPKEKPKAKRAEKGAA